MSQNIDTYLITIDRCSKSAILARMWELVRMWWVIHLIKRDGPLIKRRQSDARMAKVMRQGGKHDDLNPEDFKRRAKQIGAIHNQVRYEAPRFPRHELIETYVDSFWYGLKRRQPYSHSCTRLEENAKGAIETALIHNLIELDDIPGFSRVFLNNDGRKFGFAQWLALELEELELIRKGLYAWGVTASLLKQAGVVTVILALLGIILKLLRLI